MAPPLLTISIGLLVTIHWIKCKAGGRMTGKTIGERHERLAA
jgi:hypothetical protein